jgi:hypothetical protein
MSVIGLLGQGVWPTALDPNASSTAAPAAMSRDRRVEKSLMVAPW